MGCRIGDRKDAWKTDGEECCGGEEAVQDKVPAPIGGRLPLRLDVMHKHITTQHVVYLRYRKKTVAARRLDAGRTSQSTEEPTAGSSMVAVRRTKAPMLNEL